MYGLYQNPIIPLRREPKYFSMLSPFIFLPQLEPGETLVEFSHYYVPNIMNGRYFVSNRGRVWDAYRQIWMSYHFNDKYKPDGTNDGYCTFKVAYYASCTDIKAKDVYLHRAVLMSYNYIPGCEQLQVNHKDGDHTNNDLTNLEWVTGKENMEHASRTGLLSRSNKEAINPLSNEQINEIYMRLENGETIEQVSFNMNIDINLINTFRVNSNYRRISSRYIIPRENKPLSDEQVHEICRRLENRERIIDIHNSMNISTGIIGDIKNGKTHINISSQYNMPGLYVTYTPVETVHEICKQLELGLRNIEIAKNLNVDPNVVCNIRNKNTHRDISSQYNI